MIPMGVDFCDEHKAADLARKQAYIKQRDKAKSTTKGRQLASAHMAHYNAVARDPEANAFYHSVQWQRMRDYIYARDMGVCQVCGNAVTSRKVIDHVHPLKVSPNEKLDSNNLMTLCYRCHAIKTRIEESLKSQPNGNNKLKHISREWWVRIIKEKIK